MTCKAVRQFDEMYCSRCHARWDPRIDDFPCPKDEEPPTGDPRVESFAMAIIGPHSDAHIGREVMLRLRRRNGDVMATRDERKAAIAAAKAIISEIEHG